MGCIAEFPYVVSLKEWVCLLPVSEHLRHTSATGLPHGVPGILLYKLISSDCTHFWCTGVLYPVCPGLKPGASKILKEQSRSKRRKAKGLSQIQTMIQYQISDSAVLDSKLGCHRSYLMVPKE